MENKTTDATKAPNVARGNTALYPVPVMCIENRPLRQLLHILTIISLLNISCQTDHSENKNHEGQTMEQISALEDYEIELVSQTITKLIQPTPPPPPPPPISEDSEVEKDSNKRIDKERKEYHPHLDTTLFTFYLRDSLIVPDKGYIEKGSDTAYLGLAKTLQSDTLVARKIDLKKINVLKPYKLLTNKPDKDWPDWGDDFLGVAQYSRIIFNKDYSKAFFYFDFYCGGLCGSGHLILAEKISGKWVIIRNDMVWVA